LTCCYAQEGGHGDSDARLGDFLSVRAAESSEPYRLRPAVTLDTGPRPRLWHYLKEFPMGLILLILLILLLVGGLPTWPHSRSWGYRPTGILGVLLVVLLVLLLLNVIRFGF
jgi:hypothetical protein